MIERIFYRKEKLRGACWEYQIDGGWLSVPTLSGERHVLHHRFTFYRPREVEVRTPTGVQTLERTGAEQWFFPDRWFSLLRFTTNANDTVGYYVNFSKPLVELRANYYRDLDLELDLSLIRTVPPLSWIVTNSTRKSASRAWSPGGWTRSTSHSPASRTPSHHRSTSSAPTSTSGAIPNTACPSSSCARSEAQSAQECVECRSGWSASLSIR